MNIRKYNHLYTRVEYPLEHGYRNEPTPLPFGIQVGILETEDSKQLIVYSPIHINKEVKIKQDLAAILGQEFSDLSKVTIKELLNDIRVSQLEYEGSCMRSAVINAHQFLYFNPNAD